MDPDLCPPSLNFDISGPGVRISFYLQALFLAGLAARSDSSSEITGALYTLVITNTAYAVTTMILGFRSSPEVTLNDAVIVCYLLSGSWFAVYFALAPYNRFKKADPFLKYLSIIHSYVLFAYGFAVLATAPNFGSSPECNSGVEVVIFRPFPALNQGRIVGIIALATIVLIYTGLLITDYNLLFVAKCLPSSRSHSPRLGRGLRNQSYRSNNTSAAPGPVSTTHSQAITAVVTVRRRDPPVPNSPAAPAPPLPFDNKLGNQGHNTGVDGRMLVTLVFILTIWSLVVLNTELLIRWNKFSPPNGSQWQFGQVLPMFLVILPLVSVCKAFREHGLRRKPSKKKARSQTKSKIPHQEMPGQNPSTPGRVYSSSLPEARISQNSIHDETSEGEEVESSSDSSV